MLLVLLLAACGPNDPDNCMCDHGGTDDTAAVTDTDPRHFDPETDLEWHVIEGTDGDCGTVWPLGRPVWEFENTLGDQAAKEDSWTISGALARADVWDASLALSFYWDEGFHSHSVGVDARWRFQCDRGAWLLLGVVSSTFSQWSKHESAHDDSYAASFATPIPITRSDSTFDVEGMLWYSDGDLTPFEASPATFTGGIHDAGTEPIMVDGGAVDATHLVVDFPMFIYLFPSDVWLTEAEGLVQFDGPLGKTPSVIAN